MDRLSFYIPLPSPSIVENLTHKKKKKKVKTWTSSRAIKVLSPLKTFTVVIVVNGGKCQFFNFLDVLLWASTAVQVSHGCQEQYLLRLGYINLVGD